MSCESINKNLNKKIKAAIFDLDGTLIDTQKLYDEANQIIINKYGNGKPYDSELKLKIHGSSPSFGNRYLLKHFEINLSFEEFMKLKDDYIKDKIATCKEMEGASKLIKNLRININIKWQ